jgi:hypothetical protein
VTAAKLRSTASWITEMPGSVISQSEPVSQGDEVGGAAEQDVAVGAGVGDAVVLDEGAVAVEAVAGGDVGEQAVLAGVTGVGQSVAGEGEFAGVAADDAAQGDDRRLVGPVRAGLGEGGAVGAPVGIGAEPVDGGAVGGDPLGGYAVVQQDAQVHQAARGADLPEPPVAGLGLGGVVGGVVEEGQGVGDRFGDRLLAVQRGAGGGPGGGEGEQPAVGLAEVARCRHGCEIRP